MSYLNALRLHFAGRFQANVSTVNNDPGHFDNKAFQPSYQQMQGPNMSPPNGWFNPQGDAAYRLLGCQVTSAWMPSGAVTTTDPILHCGVADSDTQVCAKLVDLDSEQQLVSEIWGLQVRIVDSQGNTLLRGDFNPAAFIDIWDRATVSSGGDADAGAMYQSVMMNLQWGNVSASPFLSALKLAAVDGLLSIKFNVDSFNLNFTSPDFMTGRIVGTIGPATQTEPKHMVMGRQFMAIANTAKLPPANFFSPCGGLNFCTAVVDATNNAMYIDLGNALPTGAAGSIVNLGDITVGVLNLADMQTNTLGVIPAESALGYATDPLWYNKTAGVVAIPLTPSLITLIENNPLYLQGAYSVQIDEWITGAYVRADQFVYRMSSGDVAEIAVYASQFGRPVPTQTNIGFTLDASQLQPQVGEPGAGSPYILPSPNVATPADALAFSSSAVTDPNGCAILTVTAQNPGTPRYFNISSTNPQGDYGIDGQVYGIRPSFVDTQTYGSQPTNPWDFISFLVWSDFTTGTPIDWNDLQPIFQQYANLYPVMNRFLNLADYDAVVKNAHLLKLAFGLNPDNPNSMPVTRDLSPAKRNAILQWLENPIRGTVTPPAPPLTLTGSMANASNSSTDKPNPTSTLTKIAMTKGGKAAAAARRLILRAH